MGDVGPSRPELSEKENNSIGLIVDFEGPVFKKLSEQIQPEGVVSVDDNCKLLDTKVIRNDTTGGWRMILRVHRNEDNNKPVELRGFLCRGSTTLSDTWITYYRPNRTRRRPR